MGSRAHPEVPFRCELPGLILNMECVLYSVLAPLPYVLGYLICEDILLFPRIAALMLYRVVKVD